MLGTVKDETNIAEGHLEKKEVAWFSTHNLRTISNTEELRRDFPHPP